MKAKTTTYFGALNRERARGITGGAVGHQRHIHEIVAAYCSGGGHGAIGDDGFLEPKGVSTPGTRNFAQPVISNGAAVIVSPPPNLRAVIGDSPAAKFPVGTVIVDTTTS